MTITYHRLSATATYELLEKMSSQFKPSLESTLNLKEYSLKLSKLAHFQISKIKCTVSGVIAYYPNIETRILYIPIVWVNKEFQGSGLSRIMLKEIISYAINNKFKNINLEVLKNNTPAYRLYESSGFIIQEDREDKYLMTRAL